MLCCSLAKEHCRQSIILCTCVYIYVRVLVGGGTVHEEVVYLEC